MHLTSFTKLESIDLKQLKKHIPFEIEDYKAYSKWNEMPFDLKGSMHAL